MDDFYTQVIIAIIKSQEELIGSIAWDQASYVDGLVVEGHVVRIEASDPEQSLNDLVNQYSFIFGPAAVQVCISAARRVARTTDSGVLPALLR